MNPKQILRDSAVLFELQMVTPDLEVGHMLRTQTRVKNGIVLLRHNQSQFRVTISLTLALAKFEASFSSINTPFLVDYWRELEGRIERRGVIPTLFLELVERPRFLQRTVEMDEISAKAKGNEPKSLDSLLPVVISEDEFELVMGIFEKVIHDRTEFLHHGMENSMDFPAFSAAPLPIRVFATYSVPSWIPNPPALLTIAKVGYPYWRIGWKVKSNVVTSSWPSCYTNTQYEPDTANESYVCFRRRESKSVRKTEAWWATSSDNLKFNRLQMEFHYPLEIAKQVLTLKKVVAQQAQSIWDKPLAFADLKRKFPTRRGTTSRQRTTHEKPDPAHLPGLKIKTNDVNESTLERQRVTITGKIW